MYKEPQEEIGSLDNEILQNSKIIIQA